jgi:hypothetical protein
MEMLTHGAAIKQQINTRQSCDALVDFISLLLRSCCEADSLDQNLVPGSGNLTQNMRRGMRASERWSPNLCFPPLLRAFCPSRLAH